MSGTLPARKLDEEEQKALDVISSFVQRICDEQMWSGFVLVVRRNASMSSTAVRVKGDRSNQAEMKLLVMANQAINSMLEQISFEEGHR
jgi:hypothetical protein